MAENVDAVHARVGAASKTKARGKRWLYTCRAARRHRNSDISAPGLGLHALPHSPNLPIVILAVDIDAQAVQDREPLVAVCLILGTAPDLCAVPRLSLIHI